MKIDLAKKVPDKIFDIIKAVSRIADREGVPVYIVGGPVRDILLNVPNYDLDFVVEGDGIRFAEILNKNLKARLKTYRAFKTATVIFSGGRLDIATARSESYKKPAAYPDIRQATIKEDLFRRDFTINAMAAAINRKNFGELIDFYNGFRDLNKGIIRILHEGSFIDDPTRIFRGVRFAVRFSFKIEPYTKRLMKKAVLGGFLGEVNRGRIRKEVELFLEEKDPRKCLNMFGELL